jgi:hypothetical protein
MDLLRQNIFPATIRASSLVVEDDQSVINPWVFAAAAACGIWYMFILGVQAIGFTQLYVLLNGYPHGPLWY